MFESDQTYLAYELAYRSERMRGERPDQHHPGHRTIGTAWSVVRRRRPGRTSGRRAA